MFQEAFRGKRVWLSGHTGFKGAWLSEWLLRLGAEVIGFALPPPTDPALFDQLALATRMHHEIGDVRNLVQVTDSIRRSQPDFVFHLAAQSLVRLSYSAPVETYATNVMGTIHVLEALRTLEKPCAAVMVTTDKCYANREWVHGYREEDPMGGHDPYSSSKGMAELAIDSYRRSFFGSHPVQVASARAGNVIGGGDWALDRIVPDCIRALQNQQPIRVRNPYATRPWQHVLEPLSGYLTLAAAMTQKQEAALRGAFNFGPSRDANRNVRELVTEVLRNWPGDWIDESDPSAPHEAKLLQLSTDKAHALLQWVPVWPFPEAIEKSVVWYKTAGNGSIKALTIEQITAYEEAGRAAGAVWTQSRL